MNNYFRNLTDDELKKCYFERIRMLKEKDENYNYKKYEEIFIKYLSELGETTLGETTKARAIMNGHMSDEISHRWVDIISKGYYFGE